MHWSMYINRPLIVMQVQHALAGVAAASKHNAPWIRTRAAWLCKQHCCKLTTRVRMREASLCSTWGAQNRVRMRQAPCVARAGALWRGSGQCSVPWYLQQ